MGKLKHSMVDVPREKMLLKFEKQKTKEDEWYW